MTTRQGLGRKKAIWLQALEQIVQERLSGPVSPLVSAQDSRRNSLKIAFYSRGHVSPLAYILLLPAHRNRFRRLRAVLLSARQGIDRGILFVPVHALYRQERCAGLG